MSPADVRVPRWFSVRWIVDVIAPRRLADSWRMILVYGIILPLVGSLAYAQGTYVTIYVDSSILKVVNRSKSGGRIKDIRLTELCD